MLGTSQRAADRHGFTLLELIVVIGIVGILSTMLFTFTNIAREKGKSVTCRNNLRQMAGIMLAYADDHGGQFPQAYYRDKSGQHSWDFSTIDGEILPNAMWGSGTASRLHQCPSYHGPSNTKADPYTGYNYNTSYLGHGDRERPNHAPAYIHQVKDPGNTAMLGDGEYANGANKYMRSPEPDPDGGGDTFRGREAGAQGYRHLGRTNVAFVDGRVATLRERYVIGNENMLGEHCGFLSQDNSMYDLK